MAVYETDEIIEKVILVGVAFDTDENKCLIYSYVYGIMFLWEKICLQLIKMIFHMVEDMCTLCSIIWSGVQSTEKRF